MRLPGLMAAAWKDSTTRGVWVRFWPVWVGVHVRWLRRPWEPERCLLFSERYGYEKRLLRAWRVAIKLLDALE